MRGANWRRSSGGALIVVLTTMLVASCSVGPASNRAARMGPQPDATTEPEDGRGDDDPDQLLPPDEDPTTSPPPVQNPDPAEADGSAQVSGSLAEGAEGLGSVCCMTQLSGGDVLVGDRETGAIYRITENEVIDVGAIERVSRADEGALLGLAVEPGDDEWLYAYYSESSENRVARFPYSEEDPPGEQIGPYPDTLIPGGSEIIPKSTTRNGSGLAFGPDGNLYVGTGDAGEPSLAEDPASLAGKILRLTPDAAIPSDNPDTSSYIYASGFTDVQGLAWDPVGRLWVLDAGDGTDADPATISTIERDAQDGTLGPPIEVWPADDSTSHPTGLAYGEDSRSLWMTTDTDEGIWRVPLDGEGDLVRDPTLLPDPDIATAQDLIPGADANTLLALTTDGRILQLTVT